MLQVTNVGLRFGDKELFKDVNLKFTKGCLLYTSDAADERK